MATVMVAVGHGTKASGVVDPGASGGGWTELTAGEHIVDEAVRVLRGAGVHVIHEPAAGPNYPGTVRDANRLGVDYLVEVHHDWVRAPVGGFVHWYPGSDQGHRLADAILSAIVAAGFPTRPDWHKPRSDLYLLKHSRMPAVLVEAGRIGQDDLDTPDELAAMGRAIAAGILAHLGIARRVETPPTAREPVRVGHYTDTAGTAHHDAIQRAHELGLLGGYPDGTFRPGATLTRGQAATLAVNLYDALAGRS